MKKLLLVSFSLLYPFLSLFAQSRTFTGKPVYDIVTKRSGTYLGTITVELFPNIAPKHTANFDSLVNVQFFDSTAFHRVIPGFMIQGGDPNSRHGPISTWGYGDTTQPTVEAEFSVAKHLRGILSAARDSDTNSANSQFFICVATASWLNGLYSVYGHVTAGMDVVDTIVNSPRDVNDNPLQKIEMFVSYTGSNDTVPLPPSLNTPADGTTGVGASKAIKWFSVSDAIYYRVEVSTDSLFSTIFKGQNNAGLLYNVTGLAASTTYYWRVKANNGGHWSPYSPVWKFTTTGVGIEAYTSEDNVVRVSPNPGAGIFSFSNLPKNSTVEIYGLPGNLVEKVPCSTEVMNIDLRGKSAGIYFYKIITETKQVQQGKIILH
jgi:peptidyl-prolyl cis-trans isomerase B (cyclophilin B)